MLKQILVLNDLKKMSQNILFIGGAGFIGSNLIKAFLPNADFKVFVLEPERANTSRLDAFGKQVTLFQGDIRDTVSVEHILDDYHINIVVHLVSTLIPGSTFPHFQNEMNDIVLPTMNIMELCAKRKVKFVYFSSGGTIYGNSNSNHKESDSREPISYYGLSKCLAEDMIKFEARHLDLDYLILRPSNPYGPGQNIFGRQGLIAVSLGKVMNGETLQVWGDGNSVRDYIYIDDLSNIIYLLISSGVSRETLNVGSGVGYSVNDIISILDSYLDEPVRVEHVASRGVDVDSIVLDCTRLHELIDYHPINIKTGIEKFVDYIKDNAAR